MEFLTKIFDFIISDPNYTIWKILLCIFATIMSMGIIKNVLKSIPKLENIRKIILQLLTPIVGGFVGYHLFLSTFGCTISIIAGATIGYFSSVVYRILLKKIYEKYQINIDRVTSYDMSSYPLENFDKKEKE